jgi:hypothetical protein
MDEELDQIEKNDTWELVPRPKNKNVINTKWVFRNKLNEDGRVTRNKAILVCKGYAQIEGILVGYSSTRKYNSHITSLGHSHILYLHKH